MSESVWAKILASLRGRQFDAGMALERVFELFGQRRLKEASDVLHDAERRQPRLLELPLVHIMHAQLELQLNANVEQTQKWLDSAERIGGWQMSDYHRVRGDLKRKMNDIRGAVADYQRSVDLEASAASLTNLALALSEVNDERAADVWNRILKMDPHNCLAFLSLAFQAARAGDKENALLMAKNAEHSNPSARDLFEIAIVYQMIEQYQEAISAYLRADELGYHNRRHHLYAAVASCFTALGQMDQAQQYMRLAEGCGPNDEYVKTVRQQLDRCVGQQTSEDKPPDLGDGQLLP